MSQSSPLFLTVVVMLVGCHKTYSLDPEDNETDGGGGSDTSLSSDADADTDMDTDGDTDSDSDADVDMDVDSDSDSDTDADSDSDPIADTDSDSQRPFDLEMECEETTPGFDECCDTPQMRSECWWEDALEDGVTCSVDSPCPSGQECNYTKTNPMNNDGLCGCSSQSHCQMNGMDGICNVSEKFCGPSFCNGIRICSCWGGCKNALWTSVDGNTTYNNATEHCENMPDAGFCCEGIYPRSNMAEFCGYCSPDATCKVAYPES